jgi:hypothetical protein
VSPDAAVGGILTRLSDEQIEALAAACAEAASPPQALGAVVAGAGPAATAEISRLVSTWTATAGLTGAGVALALRIGLAPPVKAA